MNVYYLFLLFLIYSFLGWLMEVCISLKNKKRFINRGFLIGPICPIYGFGCVSMQVVLSNYLNNPFGLFCSAIVICSILEYLTSYMMEKMFKARWWDYSDKPFNLEGRICLTNSIAFGILGTLVMYVINPFILNIISGINEYILKYTCYILFIIVLTDYIISINTMFSIKDTIVKYSKDNTEEISKKVKAMIESRNILHRRLLDAFSNIKMIRNKIKEEKK